MMATSSGEQVYSVSELNRLARQLLEQDLPRMWVSGEISNLARPASGHLYFSLKDERAQIRCALFKGASRGINFVPANGMQVLVRGRVSLYEPRGDYQLIADHLEAAGEGLLRRRLEELKQKLAAAGLFDADRKQALPALPKSIGVITSPSGAAVRDILHILKRRFPAIPVIIYPVQVQGEQAKFDIVRAFETATGRAECEVLILARGGGSLEDLWAFNEEIVAQAIAACPIPVVSGVGHEIDFTIADLVADVRAPTPSGAAELVVPDSRDWLRHLQALERRAALASARTLATTRTRQQQLAARLARCHPGYQLRQNAQRLDELRHQLSAALGNRLVLDALRIDHALQRLQRVSPLMQLRLTAERITAIRQRLVAAIRASLAADGSRLAVLSGRLQTVSPLSTLERGYALVLDAGGKVVRSVSGLQPGDVITARVADGTVEATVNRLERG
ncbi:MAG: exodeoxyribonuclease VII large subunit [Gammaproteobacteria bacterium]|jgi:exodeoxyribonuclease VII large subunit|nr:exodeoxyribonuclease VII large subunit [Gammaproteobacteria bacterium]